MTPAATASAVDPETAAITELCARCHAMPDPAAFPKDAWKSEVAQGYRFHQGSPQADLPTPPEEVTRVWFESRAPERLEIYGGESLSAAQPLFERVPDDPQSDATAGAIASVQFLADREQLWCCDMQTGALFAGGPGLPLREVARPIELTNPCRVHAADLDGDGQNELLVTDLGSFLPEDHNRGGIWIIPAEEGAPLRPLLSPAARMCDVRSGDFDGDGDLDLVVAEFGWRRSGRLLLLWNDREGSDTVWRPQILDSRPGSIDVPVVDLNGDGRLDIVALIAQEHEVVCAFLNQGDGEFEKVVLYDAGEPAFGSSGIQVIDFDGDGDLDVLHTNGDSFDNGYAKGYHGIRWLENRGEYPFTPHELTTMPGVHKAMAADLDLDGDLDVVAVGLLPPNPINVKPGLASILWLERTPEGFTRHVIELDNCDHAACELVDWDGDGDLDLWVTHFRWGQERGTPATLFRNLTRSP